jgi:hypothetical protein
VQSEARAGFTYPQRRQEVQNHNDWSIAVTNGQEYRLGEHDHVAANVVGVKQPDGSWRFLFQRVDVHRNIDLRWL